MLKATQAFGTWRTNVAHHKKGLMKEAIRAAYQGEKASSKHQAGEAGAAPGEKKGGRHAGGRGGS